MKIWKICLVSTVFELMLKFSTSAKFFACKQDEDCETAMTIAEV